MEPGHRELWVLLDQRSSIEKLMEEVRELKTRTTTLESHAEAYEKIRMRFFDFYKRDKMVPYDQPTIQDGNSVAHDGMVDVDSMLYLKGKRTDPDTFTEIYGVTVNIFQRKYQKYNDLAYVLNSHGTIKVAATKGGGMPTKALIKAFRAVLRKVDQFIKSGAEEDISERLYNPETGLGQVWTAYKYAARNEIARCRRLRWLPQI